MLGFKKCKSRDNNTANTMFVRKELGRFPKDVQRKYVARN